MLAVQDDWIQYEEVAVRSAVVRGGAGCARPAAAVLRPVTARPRAAVRAAGASPVRRSRLRLTRRGRVVLVALPAVLALCGAALALSGTGAEAAAAPLAVRTVVVGTGDSLWSVAERLAPGRDPRDVVAALERANGLAGAAVPAGTVLRLPAGS